MSTDGGCNAKGLDEIKAQKEVVERIIVKHPGYAKLEQDLRELHEMSIGKRVNDGMFIYGRTGMGKTTLVKDYADKYPPEDLGDYTKVPVVYVRIPVGATPKTVASRILKGLGDPLFDRGTQKNMEERIDTYINACEVEMIILDELQHLIDSDTKKILTKASNWIKLFAEDVGVPIVLCGMSSSSKIFEFNEQLDRRFCKKDELKPFRYESKEEQREFRNFLFVVDQQLPFNTTSGLSQADLAEKFYYISLGVPFFVMKVLEEATVLAVRQNQECLNELNLQIAQSKITLSTRPFMVNPFNTDFELIKALDEEDASMSEWVKTNNRNHK